MALIPREIDEYFLLDILMVYLMINYNMPLAMIYFAMSLIGTLMYYVAVDKGFFRPIPFNKTPGKNLGKSLLIGLVAGVIFIWLYSVLQASNIGGVFATTAFGDSEFFGKVVFGLLIPFVETRFFFRTIMQWYAWKTRTSTNVSLTSFPAVTLMVFFGAVFTIFHATAKGVENSPELIATFAFGLLSIGMIIQLQQFIEATIMHIVINSKGVGLVDAIVDAIGSGQLLTNAWFLAAAGMTIFFLFKTGRLKKLPFFS